MPNWCENRVNIYCDSEEVIEEFAKTFMPKGFLDFTLVMPLEKYTNDECHHNWGTKWNLTEEDADNTDVFNGDISMYFDTAWAPPEGIYRAIDDWFMKKDVPYNITWFYDEPGMQFAGYLNNEVY